MGAPDAAAVEYNADKLPCRLCGIIPARLVLYIVLTTGFIINYMMRNDIHIAILAMIKTAAPAKLTSNSAQHCYRLSNQTNNIDQIVDYGGTLEWSPTIQNYVLSSFFWAYVISQCVGGAAIQRYGSKLVYGYAQMITALTNLCIPWASETHYGIVILLKIIQGIACGFIWPATYAMIGHWIPLSERSRFVTCFQGYNIGTGLSYVLGGILIEYFGWTTVFYTNGLAGLVWCVVWYLLVFDCPESHPRISLKEQQHLKKNTVTNLSQRKRAIPWKSIMLSGPVWALSITSFGRAWMVFTFIVYGPRYMKDILGFDIETNGMLSGMPYILGYLTALGFSYMGDKMISRNILSTANTRKLFTAIAQIISGVICILMGYLGCNFTTILVAWYVAMLAIPASYAGPIANLVDIAPNFAGPVGGFSQTILMVAGAVSPLVAGYLIGNGSTLAAWRTIFNIAGAVDLLTYIVFLVWGTADIQPWDYADALANSKEMKAVVTENCRYEDKAEIDLSKQI